MRRSPPYLDQWIPANHLKPGEHLKTPNGTLATADGGTTPKDHEGWMWDLTVPGNGDHDFYVLPARTSSHHAYDVEAGNTPVLVHNCGEDPTHIVSKKSDQFFDTQEEARPAALRAHGVSDDGLVETRTMYGNNPNLTGPKGEPWQQLDAITRLIHAIW